MKNYLSIFNALSNRDKEKIIENFHQKQKTFDQISSVSYVKQILSQLDVKEKFYAFVSKVNPGDEFDLNEQLKEEILLEDVRFIFTAIPVKNFGVPHSIAVVIDKEKKQVIVMDSLNKPESAIKSANLERCVAVNGGLFPEYQIVSPKYQIVQSDDWSCGVHTSINIFSIVTGQLNLESGHVIPERNSRNINEFLGALILAGNDINDDENRLNVRNKRMLRDALDILIKEKISLTEMYHLIQPMTILMMELKKELPPEGNNKRSFVEFIKSSAIGNGLKEALISSRMISSLQCNINANQVENDMQFSQIFLPTLRSHLLEVINEKEITKDFYDVFPEVSMIFSKEKSKGFGLEVLSICVSDDKPEAKLKKLALLRENDQFKKELKSRGFLKRILLIIASKIFSVINRGMYSKDDRKFGLDYKEERKKIINRSGFFKVNSIEKNLLSEVKSKIRKSLYSKNR